jgi:hypothetical protein
LPKAGFFKITLFPVPCDMRGFQRLREIAGSGCPIGSGEAANLPIAGSSVAGTAFWHDGPGTVILTARLSPVRCGSMRLKPQFFKNDHFVDPGRPPGIITVGECLRRHRARDLRRDRLPDRTFKSIRRDPGMEVETRPWARNPDRQILRSVAPWFAYITRMGFQYAEPASEELEVALLEIVEEKTFAGDACQRHRLPSTSPIWQTLEMPKGERNTIMNSLHAPAGWWQFHHFFWRGIFQERRRARGGRRLGQRPGPA